MKLLNGEVAQMQYIWLVCCECNRRTAHSICYCYDKEIGIYKLLQCVKCKEEGMAMTEKGEMQ